MKLLHISGIVFFVGLKAPEIAISCSSLSETASLLLLLLLFGHELSSFCVLVFVFICRDDLRYNVMLNKYLLQFHSMESGNILLNLKCDELTNFVSCYRRACVGHVLHDVWTAQESPRPAREHGTQRVANLVGRWVCRDIKLGRRHPGGRYEK